MPSRNRSASALRSNCRVFCGPPGNSRHRARYRPSDRLSILATPTSKEILRRPFQSSKSPQVLRKSSALRTTGDHLTVRDDTKQHKKDQVKGSIGEIRRGGDGEPACRRDSVPRSVSGSVCVAIHLCGLPEGAVSPRRTSRPSLCSALLRVGFTEPPGSPRTLVRSYRTVSPSPVPPANRWPSAVCSLLHDPSGRPDLALASTLPCGVPTFLSSHEPRPPGRLTVACDGSSGRREPAEDPRWIGGEGRDRRARTLSTSSN